MTEELSSVSILAPIPEEHLISGLDCCTAEKSVSFGSRAFEVFRKIDDLLCGNSCEVLIYSSWSRTPLPGPAKATWVASYVGHAEARHDGSPPPGLARPSSTAKYRGDNTGHWAVYWTVTDLRRIAKNEWVSVSSLRGLNTKRNFLTTFHPERPIIIHPR